MSDDAPSPELAEPQGAMSVDSAAAFLTKSLENGSIPRSDTGQFAPRAKPDAAPVAEDAKPVDDKVVDLKTGKPPVEAKAEEAVEDDDDLEFELPAEKEGEEPKRLKLTQLYEGYEKAAKLEAELEEARTATKTLPAEYQTGLQEILQTRAKYLEEMDVIARAINPVPPSLDMLDPNSAKYDPDGYYAMARKFDQDRTILAKIKQDRETKEKQQAEQQAILNKAHAAREWEALYRAWPESKNPEVMKRVIDGLANDYGFTKEEIENIGDHRQLLVIRDAIELRALKAKQADAVKVVRAKPKLVKGAARTTTDPKATARTNAMSRLQQTGSMDAAAEVLKGMFK